MKKQKAVVGLALSLSALCAFDVTPVFAGSWAVEIMSDVPYSQWETERAKRYQGEIETSAEGFLYGWYAHYDRPDSQPTQMYPPYKGALPIDDYRLDNGRIGVLGHIYGGADPEGGKGLVSVQGTIKMVLRYDPNRDENYEIDLNDKPKEPVYIRVKIFPYVSAQDGYPYGYPPQINNPGKEHVEFSAEPMGNAVGGSNSISQKSQWGRTATEGSQTFFLKFNPEGGGEVDEWGSIRYLVPLVSITKAEAKLDGDRKTFHSDAPEDYQYEWNKGQLSVDINVEGELTPYALSIASSLGPTYRKVTDAGQLPTYTNPNNGSVGVNTSRIRPETPYNGSGSGPWGLLNGYDTADTVITWNQNLLSWTGGGNFQPVESGFTAPWTRTWTATGNAPISPIVSNQMANGYNPLNGVYWNLGGDSAGNHFDRSSSLTVEVDDSSGIDPLTSTYNINWHRSLDAVERDSSRPETTVTSVSGYVPITTEGGATVTALNATQSGQFTQDLGQVKAKAGAESAELAANIGAGIVSTVPGVGTALASVFTYAGYQFGQVADPLPEDINADYDAWTNAVNTQRGLNDAGQYVGPPDVQRLWPESLKDATLTDSSTDQNFRGSTMTLRIRINETTTPIKGDSYDSQGYAGPLIGEYTKPLRFKIYTFTSSYYVAN